MDEKRNNLFKEIHEMLKISHSEKTLMEFYLTEQGLNSTIKSIGFVKDINSKYKNDFFEEIYEDENGNIIDLRLFPTTPSENDIENMTEYWLELQETFKKNVEPIFVVGEK